MNPCDRTFGLLPHLGSTEAFQLFKGPSGKISFEDLKANACNEGGRFSRTVVGCPRPSFTIELTGVNISHSLLWQAVARELGETMSDEELQEMIREADKDDDGEVSEDEFMRIIRRSTL